jgi:hypothetical protein
MKIREVEAKPTVPRPVIEEVSCKVLIAPREERVVV